jgi:hypothetical protein
MIIIFDKFYHQPTTLERTNVTINAVLNDEQQVTSGAPGAPSDVRVEWVTRSEISLVWTAPQGALRFKAEYRATTSSPDFISFGPGSTFQRPGVVIGLLQVAVPYEFRIFAGDDEGWSDYAFLSDVSPTDPPVRPTGLRELSYNQTSVTIAWSTPPESPLPTLFQVHIRQCRRRQAQDVCDAFRPYRKPGAQSDLETPEQEVQLVGLVPRALYDVVVLARNFNIAGYTQPQVDFLRISPRDRLLGSAMDLHVLGVTRSQVFLQWSPIMDAAYYR